MANYSVNQNRHLYVAEALGEDTHVPSLTNEKDLAVASFGTGNDKCMYFLYKGPDGTLRSDMINLKNLDRVEPIKASQMATKLRKTYVTLATGINSGDAVVGQDYILGINFKNFFSSGDDSQYYKDAVVHVSTANSTATNFYKAMVHSLNQAFSREDGATATSNPYLKFSINTASNPIEEGASGWAAATATGIVIEEKEQDWNLGTKKQRRIMFDVLPGYIYTGGADQCWAQQQTSGYYYLDEADPTKLTKVGNGKKIADLEWFCNGERGDQYRGMGYPNYIPFKYYVDPSKEYSVIELHFAFTDSGEASYRSEKEITIAVPNGAAGHVYDVINDIIDEIEYHSGLTIAGLSD